MATFSVSGAASTYPFAISNNGVIVGTYALNGVPHGFMRASNGAITTFDPEGSVATQGYAVNSSGTTAGYFFTYSGSPAQGFTRTADGTFVNFSVTGAASTFAQDLNDNNEVTGTYYDTNGEPHGYDYTAQGEFTFFDPNGLNWDVPVQHQCQRRD